MSNQLRQAAASGDIAKVRANLAKGADVNAPHAYSGRTALTEAAIAGHLEVARLLLAHGADINWRDRGMGLTPLGWASNFGYHSLVELFLQNGADIELGNEFSITPLMSAASNGHVAAVQLLLAAGAKINSTTTDGRTALSFALTHKRDQIVKILNDSGGAEIQSIPPTIIPWPKVDESGKECDHSTPQTVLRGFTFAMNRWEKSAAKLDKSKQSQKRIDSEMLDSLQTVFDRFCTVKKRPYGRAGSYSIPPEYDPDAESLIDVTFIGSARAELITNNKTTRHEYLYVAQKKKGQWWLDSKKTRLVGGKWMKWFL